MSKLINLKNITILVIVLFMFNASCEKKNTSACNYDNPLTEIQWLKTTVNEHINSQIPIEIYSFYFTEQEFILVIEDGFGEYIKNCSGDLICYEGDFDGNCSTEILNASQKRTLIYSQDN